ncbi:hypothetical protein BIV02_15375 [Curtobacterium sp. MMLR14_014]|uniref:hypothetical protein n=1 Tax=unclassified Curtobacterium TaxID=257496 RepID=UPI0008F80ED5|nr:MULTISPECIES: hypothetical protein [unclassified Curtobacterium]OII37980.1 hypothetical protein BIU91_10595 [Curtobacterium sp. MMLR14_002]OII44869.1 hypothetical protein BIV02_15375 [Curtobacterium sp. MMLR14_014]
MTTGSFIVLAGLLWLTAGPRVDIMEFAGSSVRIEDALLALALVAVVAQWKTVRPLINGRTGIALVTMISIATAGIAAVLGTVHLAPALLYAVRPFEYWAIFPVALALLDTGGRRAETALVRVLALTTIAHSAVATAQFLFGFNIGFSAFSLERGAGLTNGPYELGAIMAMLICFWLAEGRMVLAAVAAGGLLMSLSRISIIGAMCGLAAMAIAMLIRKSPATDLRKRTLRPGSVITATVAIVAILLAFPLLSTKVIQPAIDRTQSTSISASWEAGRQLAAITPRSADSDQYAATAYEAIGDTVLDNVTSGDASNEVRFYRWNLLLNEITRSSERVFLGLGPSFAGPSVDGAYLRIVAESGLVGAIVWMAMFGRWIRRAPAWFVGAAVSLFVGGVFIDIFYAERPMVFLWLLLALAVHRGSTRKTAD